MKQLLPGLAAAGVIVLAVTLVALTLRPTAVPTYSPTPAAPREVGRGLAGPTLYTIDATAAEAWRHFAFHLGSVIDGPESWDLAFRRYAIVAGPGAGILDLGEIRFDDVRTVPATGYLANEGRADPRNPAIASWYAYGFLSHVLSPKPRVWAVRTADGRYAKLEMLGYYCPGSTPGCPTFRYVYQGDGSTSVAP
jgi:heme-binding HmuY-like protein